MKKYLKALPTVLIIGIVLLGTFYYGKSQSEVIIQGRPPCDAEKYVGATKPVSIVDTIRNTCNCPDTEIVYNVGCTDGITTTNKVRVNAPIVEKYNTILKKYESFEELKDTITDLTK